MLAAGVSLTLAVLAVALLAAGTAEAKPPKGPKEPILQAAVSYPDMTTYSCRTDAITIYPGQNLNLFATDEDLPERAEGQRTRRRQRL